MPTYNEQKQLEILKFLELNETQTPFAIARAVGLLSSDVASKYSDELHRRGLVHQFSFGMFSITDAGRKFLDDSRNPSDCSSVPFDESEVMEVDNIEITEVGPEWGDSRWMMQALVDARITMTNDTTTAINAVKNDVMREVAIVSGKVDGLSLSFDNKFEKLAGFIADLISKNTSAPTVTSVQGGVDITSDIAKLMASLEEIAHTPGRKTSKILDVIASIKTLTKA